MSDAIPLAAHSSPATALGRGPRVLVLGDNTDAFEAAAALIAAIPERQGRIGVALSGPVALRSWLTERFPRATVLAPPRRFGPLVRRFILENNIRALATLDDVDAPRALIDGMKHEGRPLVALRARNGAPPPRACVVEGADATLDLGRGWEAAGAAIDRALARDFKPLRSRSRFALPNLLLTAIRQPTVRELSRKLIRRIDGIEALRAELGRPRTVMCLGNGPSSEDPRLADVAFDALFRVNRSWQKRETLTAPDVVFTAMSKAMKRVDGAIFGLQTHDAERRLVKTRVLKKRVGKTRFFRVSELSDSIAAHAWGEARPSNGATMMATAVALQPERLVVAGIDLFRHPEGAYPGDASTPNAYTPAHDADAELAFMMRLFADYRGELVIFGDALNDAWLGTANVARDKRTAS